MPRKPSVHMLLSLDLYQIVISNNLK